MPIRHLAAGLLPAAAMAAGLFGAPPAQAQTSSDKMSDFMIMDVCVDRQDKILPDLVPGDRDCSRHRNIKAGEAIPYHLHNFPAPNGPCPQRLGTVSKDNIPVTKDGVTRIVSFYDRGVDHSCPKVAPDAPTFGKLDTGKEGGSVQWADDRYGYIMGSWSPVALSYWLTPSCTASPNTSGRFRYGWVIAPAVLPPTGGSGYAVFDSKLVAAKGADVPEGCPKRFNHPFTAWTRDNFTYKSGRDLDTVISMRFSGSSRDGTGPGDATQVEITYWTKEFGLTRWEKWARADWVHPRSLKAAPDLGRTLYSQDTCSQPYVFHTALAPGLAIRDGGGKDGDYSRDVTDPKSGESHEWHMSLCSDYTNVVKDPEGGLVPPWGQAISDIFWQE